MKHIDAITGGEKSSSFVVFYGFWAKKKIKYSSITCKIFCSATQPSFTLSYIKCPNYMFPNWSWTFSLKNRHADFSFSLKQNTQWPRQLHGWLRGTVSLNWTRVLIRTKLLVLCSRRPCEERAISAQTQKILCCLTMALIEQSSCGKSNIVLVPPLGPFRPGF